MIPPLQRELARVATRIHTRRRQGQAAIFWAGAALASGALLGLHLLGFAPWWLVLLIMLGIASGGMALHLRHPKPDLRGAARAVENANPQLHTALLAAIDQSPENGRLNYLQTRVVDLALASAELGGWDEVAPARDIRRRRWLARGGTVLTGLALLATLSFDLANQINTWRTAATLEVSPGNAEIERGSPVTFTARFTRDLPPEAKLEITDAAGARQELPLTRTLEDPVFTAALPAVDKPLRYRVDFGAGRSEEFALTVFDPPRVEELDATLKFPAYTGQPDARLENSRILTAIEQTRLTLEVRTNVPMRAVELHGKDGPPIPLARDAKDSARYTAQWQLARSGDYQVAVVDEAGRENPAAETLKITVHPNQPPVVKAKLPSTRDRAGALQEVSFEAQIDDDFGLRATGLTVQIGEGKPHDVTGPEMKPGTRSSVIKDLVKLEDLHARPNDLVMWNAWGEDLGPDGQPRRTNGDVHILPVRSFDEISRQREPAEGQVGESRCLKCIRIQTQILRGTWDVQRTAVATEPPPAEVKTLHDSQAIALDIARQLEEDFSEPEQLLSIKSAQTTMERSLGHLKDGKRSDLPPAITAEQGALASLYKLLSNERLYQLAKEGQPSEGGAPPQDEIDLENMLPRYQSESAAQDDLDQKGRETRETLSRLKDLADRQRDLNEELNRLLNAQRLAKTDAEKAEVERQLKRLREQQRDLKSDLDHTRQRMAESDSPKPDARTPQLDRAAAAAERSAQKMEAKKLGEALAEGARAQKDLERAEENYRKTSSSQLAEQLRDLRERTREVAENQQKLGEDLTRNETPLTRRTLRPDLDTLEAQAAKQAEEFNRLMDAIANTARNAAETDPLVSRRLEEAARESEPRRIAAALDSMRASAAMNNRDATLAAQKSADAGLQSLRQRVDDATAKVLGGPRDSLRYAQSEIDRLRRSLASANSPGTPSKSSPSSQDSLPSPSSQQGQQGQQGQQSQQSQQSQQGEGEGDMPGAPATAQASNPGNGSSGTQPGESSASSPGSPAANSPASGAGGGSGSSPNRSASGMWTAQDTVDFRNWTDRLQDLEAMVDVPEARSALARARGAARDLRRQSRESRVNPPQSVVQQQILEPLLEAETRIREALASTDQRNPLAPVERDPVPEKYSDVVRTYYEALGQ